MCGFNTPTGRLQIHSQQECWAFAGFTFLARRLLYSGHDNQWEIQCGPLAGKIFLNGVWVMI
jgi:hypothetical protein